MKNTLTHSICLYCVVILIHSISAWAETESKNLDVVLDAIQSHALAQPRADELEVERWGEVLAYEYSWRQAGHEHEIIVSDSGDILVIEVTVSLNELPAAVQTAMQNMGWTKFKAERITVVVYELERTDLDVEQEVIVMPWGRVVPSAWLTGGIPVNDDDDDDEHEDQDDDEIGLSDVPPEIRSTAQRVFPGIELLKAEQEVSSMGTIVYEIEGRVIGDQYEIEVGVDGKLIGVELQDNDDSGDDM